MESINQQPDRHAESVAGVIGQTLETLARFPGTQAAVNPHEIIESLRSAGYVIVPAKIEPKGPRAQVITPSDSVCTKEGQILAVALHAVEERELDLLAKIGRLERLVADPGRCHCGHLNASCDRPTKGTA